MCAFIVARTAKLLVISVVKCDEISLRVSLEHMIPEIHIFRESPMIQFSYQKRTNFNFETFEINLKSINSRQTSVTTWSEIIAALNPLYLNFYKLIG